MTDARDVGNRVLEALAEGRRRHHEQDDARVREIERLVTMAALADEARGHGPWGRATRIAKRLHGLIARRTVQKYLARHSERANSSAQAAPVKGNGHAPE